MNFGFLSLNLINLYFDLCSVTIFLQAELDSMKAAHMHELDALRRQTQVVRTLVLFVCVSGTMSGDMSRWFREIV